MLETNGVRLAGRHILITAGPTHEPIDPVRYIANRSSGKQGHAIAEAAARAGARRYGIKVRDLEQAPREAELVVFDRFPNEIYRLEIRKVGTKKRKPLQLYA